MKSPLGFGKNYFTMSAILAYSVQSTLNSQFSSFVSIKERYSSPKQEDEDEPPDDFQDAHLLLLSNKPCHCNRIFKIKARLMLLLHHYIPRCPFYTVCFAYRRTGVHPPLTF